MRPDLTPLASVWLTLPCPFLLIYQFPEPSPGFVALHQTPLVRCHDCFTVPDDTQIFVSLAADGRTSFTVADHDLQAAVLKRVDQRYSRCLPPSLTTGQHPLTDSQLLACVKAARTLAPDVTVRQAHVYLMIDAETGSSAVMHLLGLLRHQHINQLNLVVHCRT